MIKTGNKKSTDKNNGSILFPVFLFLFFITPLLFYSQNTGKRIKIEHAGSLQFDKNLGNGAQRLIGDVKFSQENTLMYCDSAYLYKDNSLDAFGHVHIQQGDSIHLYGDLLKYNGNTKKAIITKNVVVIKGDMRLTTEELNYDVGSSIGYYIIPARITSKENILTSSTGYFFARSNMLTFKKDVVLTNPQFVINCDTMRYNTSTKTTYFAGPTTIKSKDNLIYTEDGWYDTFHDLSRFSKNSYIVTKEQKMFGDSLYYDRKNGLGKAIKNVKIIDTTKNLYITGEHALHYEFTGVSIVTKNALLTCIFDTDTLFLHADTLKAVNNNSKFTENKKSNNQQLFAYHKVKFYKSDLQGKCDSMYYSINDSTMHLFNNPVLWSAENQLTADSIKLTLGQKSIETMDLKGSAFIVSEEDSIHFNQIRGKIMKGHFQKNKLYLINIEGNGQTIYYIKEKNKVQAVNRADCSNLRIYLTDNQIDRITFITKPEATLFPIDQVDLKELRLKDFNWRKKERPKSLKEIF